MLARSHVCNSCGTEMGSIPPTFEPCYGFPIVRCPRCARVSVRSFYRTDAAIRRGRRLAGGIWYAGCNTGLSVGIGVLMLGFVGAFSRELVSYGLSVGELAAGIWRGEHRVEGNTVNDWYRDVGQVWIVGMVCVSAFSGASWAFLWPHWRRWALIVTWVATAHAAFLAPIAINRLDRLLTYLPGPGQPGVPLPTMSDWGVTEVSRAWPLLWISLMLGIAGFPLGRIVKRLLHRSQRAMLRIYKHRRRLARAQT